MNSTFYAIINKETNVVESVVNTFENNPYFDKKTHYSKYIGDDETTASNMFWKKYIDGSFIENNEPYPILSPVEPTEEELIIAQTLINQASIKEQLNVIDKTNSQILLKLVGGN